VCVCVYVCVKTMLELKGVHTFVHIYIIIQLVFEVLLTFYAPDLLSLDLTN